MVARSCSCSNQEEEEEEGVVEESFDKPGLHGHSQGSLAEESAEVAIAQAECLACCFEGCLIRLVKSAHCFY